MEASISSMVRPTLTSSHGCLLGTFSIKARNHNVGFVDNSHLQYYNRITAGKKKDTVKGIATAEKKLKLFSDLSMFANVGGSVVTQELSEILMAQKQQINAQKREMKKKRKEENIRLRALKKKSMKKDSDSSSSSSDSSDSDCEQVLRINRRLKGVALVQEPSSTDPSRLYTSQKLIEVRVDKRKQLELYRAASFCSPNNMATEKHKVEAVIGRVDVCMGSKCKKLGAEALLKELESKIGVEGGVVGCKCMGKCRSAPNVRISNSSNKDLVQGMDKSVSAATNPLYIGVSLQDVDMIVSNILGEDRENVCRTAAA